ncbi:hypothetical protein GCM10023347_13760 [Streptomyces chumphonensis]
MESRTGTMPVVARRWLRAQALRIADRLDPDPHRAAWVRPFMRMPTVPAPDAASRLGKGDGCRRILR